MEELRATNIRFLDHPEVKFYLIHLDYRFDQNNGPFVSQDQQKGFEVQFPLLSYNRLTVLEIVCGHGPYRRNQPCGVAWHGDRA